MVAFILLFHFATGILGMPSSLAVASCCCFFASFTVTSLRLIVISGMASSLQRYSTNHAKAMLVQSWV
jgi:hypothetical protein